MALEVVQIKNPKIVAVSAGVSAAGDPPRWRSYVPSGGSDAAGGEADYVRLSLASWVGVTFASVSLSTVTITTGGLFVINVNWANDSLADDPYIVQLVVNGSRVASFEHNSPGLSGTGVQGSIGWNGPLAASATVRVTVARDGSSLSVAQNMKLNILRVGSGVAEFPGCT